MQKPSIGARAGSSSTRKQLEGFGSVGLPGSGRLDDKRYKAHTLGSAHLAGVQKDIQNSNRSLEWNPIFKKKGGVTSS